MTTAITLLYIIIILFTWLFVALTLFAWKVKNKLLLRHQKIILLCGGWAFNEHYLTDDYKGMVNAGKTILAIIVISFTATIVLIKSLT